MKVFSSRIILAVLAASFLVSTASANAFDSQEHRFRVTTIVSGLEHPWGMAFLPDGRIMVTERPGRLRLIENGRLLQRPVAGLPEINEVGQGGLLDVALHPDFESNGWVYFTYVGPGESGWSTELGRGRLNERDELEDVAVLFRAEPKSGGGRHFGSRIVFDRAGYVYFGMGDRGDRPRAQILGDHAGSIFRLNDDGSVPDDNPFVGRSEARPEIFAYGVRNPQGMTLHPTTGELWEHEHGPRGGDEVNVIRAGRNYGWPLVTYGRAYSGFKIGEGTSKPGIEEPLHYWVPSIAPSGMTFYSGSIFPRWRGSLFVGSLKFSLLARLQMDGERIVGEERLIEGELGRIRDVREGPDGYLYLLTDAPDGVLARIEPAD